MDKSQNWITPGIFAKADDMKPLDEADRNRPAPPANPTGIPGQKPLPVDEVAKLAESAGKSLLDAGLDLEKAFVGIQKIATMATMTDGDRGIAERASQISEGVAKAKEMIASLASQAREFGGGLKGPAQPSGWTEK